ncbi:MAG: substrate-binding domain-containing protein [bacterium]|nr:substrate-binding domain-containing protein [bacterium]
MVSRKRVSVRVLAAVAMMGLLIGMLAGGAEVQAKDYKIALVMKTLSNPFFVDMEDGAKEAAEELGVKLIVQAAERETDTARQMEIVENLIIQKVDAICLVPSGSQELALAIKKANDANIPVLIVDSKMDPEAMKNVGASALTFIGSDNYLGGSIAADALSEALGGKGKVAVLEGISGHETAYARDSGFKETLAKKSPEMEIVASQPANWERAQGMDVFTNLLEAHPEIQGLFAANDMMALGAIQAIKAAKRDDIVVIGFDAVDDAKEAIKVDDMLGSIAQYPSAMGSTAVKKAVEVIEGGTIEEYIGTKVELITKDML